jgi:hypothetical protein
MALIRGIRWALLVTVLALAAAGCRGEQADVDELLTLRGQGLLYLQQDLLTEAEEAFERLIELAPDDPLGYANLGLTYLRGGRYPEAEEQLLHAHELDPANADIALMLARVYASTGRTEQARATLEELRGETGGEPRVLFALAELDAGSRDAAAAARYEQRLREVLGLAPANLAVRLRLAEALLRRGQADSVVRHLEEVRRIPPAPPPEAMPFLDAALEQLRAGRTAEAAAPLERLVRAMELTSPYQASLAEVKWVEGAQAGRPILTFTPADFLEVRGLRQGDTVEAVHFEDVSLEAGLPESPPAGGTGPTVLAVGDAANDGSDDLFAASPSPAPARLYGFQGGYTRDLTERAGIALPGGAAHAVFADYDNDGWLDLFSIGGDGRGHLFHNRGNAVFEDVSARARITDVRGGREAVFVDLDHDGDLDLLVVGDGPRRVYRNNLDGTFTESSAAYGLAGGAASDAVFADFDDDGRIDLFLTNAAGAPSLYRNGGVARFSDATGVSGISIPGGSGPAAVGDFDNDGFLDLFVTGAGGGAATLWTNRGDGTFTRGRAPQGLPSPARALEALDYDNDGWLDLLVAGESGAALLRNAEGTLQDRSALLPATVRAGSSLASSDVDADGDLDVLVGGTGGAVRLLRNDGGNLNLAVRVELKALRTGSGKNNDFGVGARVQLRAGEIQQTRVVTGRVTHFGLGPHLKADVLRVEWPNGVPQTVYVPGTDQDVVETEMLKGSCAFAYTWDGTAFRFVTDVMWRSALGMPLGLMGSGTAFAPAGASQEYLRIPGEALKPRDGRYLLQITEELWETAYLDEIKLLAVDHPDSIDVFVDETFVPPGPLSLRLYRAAGARPPVSARDEKGNDLLPALRARDDVFVSNLTPLEYQGLVETHDLVLDLGAAAGGPGTYLFLHGWIYPTDASINVALSQRSDIKPAAPSLEVRDASGRWVVVEPSLGFPSGKDKTMVIDLAGRFPTRDHHVRIRTNLQIYWDHVFVAGDAARSEVRVTTLSPVSADLRARGFSRMYRKGGRYGPYWYDYQQVGRDSPWRPIEGAFTRLGNVLPLLGEPDDMYVIMAPGDETALQFEATGADALPPGWKRDFLLYTDGWIKDSDLNTAHGTTVGPLPFHAVKEYPYAPGDAYPDSPAHRRYMAEYNTRVVGRR